MNKKLLMLLALPLLLTGCSNGGNGGEFEGLTLTIYNCEDYISNGEDDSEDLIADFEEMYGCKVNYYTYDVNETMYNQFKLQQEGTYDLICTSDYMIQKMIKEGLVNKMENISENVPNYDQFASTQVRNKLKQMKVTVDGEESNLDEYAVGYMWGTLGLTYDPSYTDTIREDIKSWDILWDEEYANISTIKNSMRDAYVVGLMHYFGSKEEYANLRNAYLQNPSEENAKAYNDYIQDVFDLKLDGSEASIAENNEKINIVKDELISVKDNIFGFETDAGKLDMVEGSKIKINLAWSGDAVYSMYTALDEADKVLEYYVPDDGANIWYDAWFMPKGIKQENVELAYKFLDFISSPESAAANMDYIGYTPFITGSEVYQYVAESYGAQVFTEGTCYYAYDEEEDFMDLVVYDNKLYLCIQDTDGEIVPTNAEYFECLDIEDPNEELDLEYQDMISYNGKIYQCYEDSATSLDELEEVEPYDLTHIFGNCTGHDELIYAWAGYENMLECQYPSQDIITRCAIMNDFGDYNAQVIIMWGQIKAYTNMTPYYVFLICFVVIVLGLSLTFYVKKRLSSHYKRSKIKKAK